MFLSRNCDIQIKAHGTRPRLALTDVLLFVVWRKQMKRTICKMLKAVALSAAFFGVTSAQAGFSTIKNNLLESTQEGILEHQYGGNWHKVGDDYYNGSMRAMRMDDALSDSCALNIGKSACGDASDQLWCGDKFKATAVAKFSGNSQNLNTVDSSNHVNHLLNVKGYGFNIDPASAVVDMDGKEFAWQRKGDSGTQSSLNSANADGGDHLITFVIEGLPGVAGPVWMLFFEDMNKLANTPVKRTYSDYNDLVVEIRSVAHAVPLPPAGWAGLTTLSGMALVRGRKLISKALAA